MNVIYRQHLDVQKIQNTQEITHELWGEGKVFEERFQKLIRLTRHQEGRWLRVSGLENSQGQVLCSLKRYLLQLVNSHAEVVDCIGLGAVFTTPEVRRQGLAARLIHQVMKEAHDEGISCALLYSDIEPTYYEQFGFKRLPARNYTIPVKADMEPLVALEMRLASTIDLPWLVQCYEKSWPKGVLRIHRNRESWQFCRLLNAGPGLSDWIFSENGIDLGYITVVKKRDHLWVEEFALDPDRCMRGGDSSSLSQQMWNAVSLLAKKYHLQQIKGWLNPNQYHPGCHIEDRQKAIPMVADLADFRERGRAIIPYRFDLSKFTLSQSFMGSMDHF